MESKIARAVALKHDPVAVLVSDEKPEGALQFTKGKWGCVMFLFANAARGKTAVFDRETYGCWGGGVGLGFGTAYLAFPGGTDCFSHFLSSGNARWEKGRQMGEMLKQAAGAEFAENFLEGERYKETPELVDQFLTELPMRDLGTQYVQFAPLSRVDPEARPPETVVFLADPDQLSALVNLVNYARPGIENVIIPWAAGCQTIGILPFREAEREKPRAVVGLTDLSARKSVRKLLGPDVLSFSMPWTMFLAMEEKVEGSFLSRPTWQALVAAKMD
ncbi:MAG: DUF169 domain-containing protein [Thermodesulfobacteriota bacterium]